jgi:hypothetical protein
VNFFLGWPQTSILPIFSSQVARITGVSHCDWPSLAVLYQPALMELNHFFKAYLIYKTSINPFMRAIMTQSPPPRPHLLRAPPPFSTIALGIKLLACELWGNKPYPTIVGVSDLCLL